MPGTGGNLGICLDSVGLAGAVALFSNPEEDKLSMLTFQNIQIFAGLHLLLRCTLLTLVILDIKSAVYKDSRNSTLSGSYSYGE